LKKVPFIDNKSPFIEKLEKYLIKKNFIVNGPINITISNKNFSQMISFQNFSHFFRVFQEELIIQLEPLGKITSSIIKNKNIDLSEFIESNVSQESLLLTIMSLRYLNKAKKEDFLLKIINDKNLLPQLINTAY
jgi:hypothetical protein